MSQKFSDSSESNPDSPTADDRANAPETKPLRSQAEQISFGLSVGLLLIIVGLVSYIWVSRRDQDPPDIQIHQIKDIRTSSGQFYVPFEIKNVGGQTVESVQVVAELSLDGEVVQSGEQIFDFLSSNEIEEGAFVFTYDPQSGELALRVASYKLP